jgi:hypothetical protein
MARSAQKTIKIPQDVWDAVKHLRKPGGAMHGYPSDSAAIVGTLLYAAIFPKPHRLTMALAKLLVHRFILTCLEQGTGLAAQLPKPATADALVQLAVRKGRKPQVV